MDHEPSDSLEGKVILVTGATSGIGRATAEELIRRGSTVIATGRDLERGHEILRLIEGAGGSGSFLPADLEDPESVEQLFARIESTHGRLDGALNNAASLHAIKPLHDYDTAEFAHVIDNTLRSVWLCMKHEISMMSSAGGSGGSIVNTSSVNGLGGVPGASLYAMAKAGVIALSKSAAIELASSGIRVNVLVPGAFETPMLRDATEQAAGGDPDLIDQMTAARESMIPFGRIGRPEEAASAVVWLLSDSSSYVTGHSLIVDGGLTAAFR